VTLSLLQPTIRISSRRSVLGCMQNTSVFIDGQMLGFIANGGKETFSVEPGRHTLSIGGQRDVLLVALGMGIREYEDSRIELDVSAGDLRTFECGIVAWVAPLMSLILVVPLIGLLLRIFPDAVRYMMGPHLASLLRWCRDPLIFTQWFIPVCLVIVWVVCRAFGKTYYLKAT